ncbi:MAG: nicotinate-nucleotide adenylyltransferase [Clostridiales bacterium]|jgi:nicotinate-nucleotide adenylyltransferase|nr:nicotinate-nucleotide adenylyltransferase [Clostridiales bacterium]
MIESIKNKKSLSENCMVQVGIMGGTFDPIHYGHLVTAEAVRAKFSLDHVIFVPSGNPPHKIDQKVTDKNHRYLMTLLATATNQYFKVSRDEIDREGYTYTIDTIKNFNIQFSGKAKFYFITGADALNEILTWKDAESLLQMCEFVAATRPGYKYEELFRDIEYLTINYNSKIHLVEVPSLAISSTDIRERVKSGQPIKYLLPESVENYIYKNSLYTGT